MSNFAIILVCLAVGYLFRYLKIAQNNDFVIINKWVIYIGLPSIALKFIPQIEWKLSYLFTASAPVIIFLFSYLFFKFINTWTKFSKRSLYTLIIISGLSNTSFVGFPLIISFFGQEQLKVGIVSDQLTFFLLSTFGVMLATSAKPIFASDREKYMYIVKRIVTFPPLIGCVIALAGSDILDKPYFIEFFSMLAATVSPMALFSIGMQLNFNNTTKEIKAISWSLLYKLVLGPTVILIIAYIADLRGVFYQVSVFEMCMPSLVASSIVIQKFGLNNKLANTIIGVSILAGLALSFVWYAVVTTFL